jgi:hypothetical protein
MLIEPPPQARLRRLGGSMRGVDPVDIALVAFAIILISAMLIAFVI